MTEKRFTYDNKQVAILKDGEFWLDGQIDTSCNHSEICNELNNLVKENEQLQKDCTALIHHNQEYRKENEQLKSICQDHHDHANDFKADCIRLEKENEQLKAQLASINQLIDNKIDEFKNGYYGDLPCNTIHMFLDLKEEIGDFE